MRFRLIIQMGTGCGKNRSDQYFECRLDLTVGSKSAFTMVAVVGKGGFGKVWKAIEKKTKIVYAVKVIDKAKVITKKSVNSVMNERHILSKLLLDPHDFLVNMKYSFQDRDNLYLVMDYLEAGDLRYYINNGYIFKEHQIKFLVRCLIEGLKYLHQHNIIHRDIKPENIIIDRNGYCRITDLGIARQWKIENSNETSGTPGYMAPEVLLRQNHSFCADYFAVGVIAYELIVGSRPYVGRDRKSIRDAMLARQAKLPPNMQGTVTSEAADFINKMITRSARKRLGYGSITEITNHPWLEWKGLEKEVFLSKKARSPITPLQSFHSEFLQEATEPDDVWRDNKLLLKNPDVQRLFQNYEYHPEMSRMTAVTEKNTAGTQTTA